MAIPLLLSAANFLGGATKKAMSPNTKNTAVVEKDGKGEGDKSGAIVKSEQVSITPTSKYLNRQVRFHSHPSIISWIVWWLSPQ